MSVIEKEPESEYTKMISLNMCQIVLNTPPQVLTV